MRELPEDLVMLAPLAMKSSLKKPEGILQWSSNTTEKFKEISQDGAAEFLVNKITPGETAIVQLTFDGRDVAQEISPKTFTANVSFLESVDNFWVQKTEHFEEINVLETELAEIQDWTKIENPQENDLVAAIAEGIYTRAKVLSVEDQKYKVLYIDYGNTNIVDVVYKLPESVKTKPFYATQCKLENLPGHKWSDDVNKRLEEISNDGKY